MSYIVKLGFDETTKRYYVLESELPGLNIEAESFEEFCALIRDVAPDLVDSPHEPLDIQLVSHVLIAA